MKTLWHNIGVYQAIERYYNRRWPLLRAIEPGFRGWLDGFAWLERDHQDCGCKALGGGGYHYCSSGHLLERLGE